MAKAEGGCGWIYFLVTEDFRYVKIGRTTDLDKRILTLKIQLPFRAQLVHYIWTDDPQWLESFLHRAFKCFRRNGEWFDLLNKYTLKTYLGAWLKREYWDRKKQAEFERQIDEMELAHG